MNIQQSYREATVQGANPVELVVRLYEQMIEDLRQVEKAIEQKDIKLRTKKINHVILIVGHLQSSLDFGRGGKVARDLENFYNALRESVVYVQFHPSPLGVTRLITDLLAVREAWIAVEHAEYPSAPSAAAPSAEMLSAGIPEREFDMAQMDEGAHRDWNG
jgi:flagellar secretion chaperone FliS